MITLHLRNSDRKKIRRGFNAEQELQKNDVKNRKKTNEISRTQIVERTFGEFNTYKAHRKQDKTANKLLNNFE